LLYIAPYKEVKEVITGDRGGKGVGPSLPIHLFGNVASKNLRKCEPPIVELNHLVEKLSTAETLLRCNIVFF
jgi:hypothetical protein